MFNFHRYPWLVHRLAHSRKNHANLHVRGYKEKGSIDTPLGLAMANQVDRCRPVSRTEWGRVDEPCRARAI